MPFTPGEYAFMLRGLRTWLWLRAEHEPRFADLARRGDPHALATALANDADHSALLRRLVVDGKPPLPEPPPLDHAYPVYPE